jgi:hypothetical protein
MVVHATTFRTEYEPLITHSQIYHPSAVTPALSRAISSFSITCEYREFFKSNWEDYRWLHCQRFQTYVCYLILITGIISILSIQALDLA